MPIPPPTAVESRVSAVIKQGAEAEAERMLRSKNKYKRKMEKSDFREWKDKSGGNNSRSRSNNIKIISDSDDVVNFDFTKPMWMRFEDRVWTMFHEIGIEGRLTK